MVWPAIIGAAGSIAGTALSNNASAKEAKKNREFQERMSSTAFQRAADDLEAAGLNRILALGSPASTPGGATAQVADYGSAFQGGAQAGMAVATGAKSVNKMDAEIGKIMEETKVISERAKQELEKTQLWKTLAPIMVQAGKDFQAVMEAITSDQMREDVYKAINAVKNMPGVLDDMAKVMADRYDQSVQNLSDWFTGVADKMNKSDPARRLQLGNGRIRN